MKATRHFRSSLVHTGLLLAVSLPAMSAQMTDYFADRPQITGATAVLTADTASATTETGELPYIHGNQRDNTVWGEWIAPGNGWVVIDTLGTVYRYPMVAVFTGGEITALSTVARGYDPGAPDPARVRFPVAAGTAYQIMLDSTLDNSSGAGAGKVNIHFTADAVPPSVIGEDVFDYRPELSGSQALGVANNEFAGRDPFEMENPGRRNQSVWWQWTAPTTGRVTLDTLESEFRTTLTVFAGENAEELPFAGLDEVADNNNVLNSTRSRLAFQTQAGRTYQIRVDGDIANNLGEGDIILRLDLVPNPAPAGIPGADDFSRRGLLSGIKATGVACNMNSTIEAFEPSSGGTRRKSVWWTWTAPANCTMTVDTIGSLVLDSTITGMNTVVKVFRGSVLEALQEVAANDDMVGSTWSQTAFNATKGTIYQIVVDGDVANRTGEGNIILNLSGEVVPEIMLAPEIVIQEPVGSNLADDRTRKSFGTVRVGAKSVVKTFTIRNTGTAPLTGLAISRSGTHAGDFFVGPLATSKLAPGASTTFKVTFFPKAKGTRTATLVIRSNDADENPFGIPVTGMGVRR